MPSRNKKNKNRPNANSTSGASAPKNLANTVTADSSSNDVIVSREAQPTENIKSTITEAKEKLAELQQSVDSIKACIGQASASTTTTTTTATTNNAKVNADALSAATPEEPTSDQQTLKKKRNRNRNRKKNASNAGESGVSSSSGTHESSPTNLTPTTAPSTLDTVTAKIIEELPQLESNVSSESIEVDCTKSESVGATSERIVETMMDEQQTAEPCKTPKENIDMKPIELKTENSISKNNTVEKPEPIADEMKDESIELQEKIDDKQFASKEVSKNDKKHKRDKKKLEKNEKQTEIHKENNNTADEPNVKVATDKQPEIEIQCQKIEEVEKGIGHIEVKQDLLEMKERSPKPKNKNNNNKNAKEAKKAANENRKIEKKPPEKPEVMETAKQMEPIEKIALTVGDDKNTNEKEAITVTDVDEPKTMTSEPANVTEGSITLLTENVTKTPTSTPIITTPAPELSKKPVQHEDETAKIWKILEEASKSLEPVEIQMDDEPMPIANDPPPPPPIEMNTPILSSSEDQQQIEEKAKDLVALLETMKSDEIKPNTQTKPTTTEVIQAGAKPKPQKKSSPTKAIDSQPQKSVEPPKTDAKSVQSPKSPKSSKPMQQTQVKPKVQDESPIGKSTDEKQEKTPETLVQKIPPPIEEMPILPANDEISPDISTVKSGAKPKQQKNTIPTKAIDSQPQKSVESPKTDAKSVQSPKSPKSSRPMQQTQVKPKVQDESPVEKSTDEKQEKSPPIEDMPFLPANDEILLNTSTIQSGTKPKQQKKTNLAKAIDSQPQKSTELPETDAKLVQRSSKPSKPMQQTQVNTLQNENFLTKSTEEIVVQVREKTPEMIDQNSPPIEEISLLPADDEIPLDVSILPDHIDVPEMNTDSKNVQGSGFAPSVDQTTAEAKSLVPKTIAQTHKIESTNANTSNEKNAPAPMIERTHDNGLSSNSTQNLSETEEVGNKTKVLDQSKRSPSKEKSSHANGNAKNTHGKSCANSKKSNGKPIIPPKPDNLVSSQVKKSQTASAKAAKLEKILVLTGTNADDEDSEDDYIEYKFMPRQVFIATICQSCKKPTNINERVLCQLCHMVSYCSAEHLTKDEPQHKDLCAAFQEIAKKRGGHIYNNARILNDNDYRSLRVHTLNLCENFLKRPLQTYEREILLFPRLCTKTSCREWRPNLLADCDGCGQAFYCSAQPNHLVEKHQKWCKSVALYRNLVVKQSVSGRIEPSLPSRIQIKPYTLPNTIGEVFKDLYKNYAVIRDECVFATLTQLATAPLTAYFATQKAELKIAEKFTIHLIGAELQFEADVLDIWETFFLHLANNLVELTIVFCGPELNAENIPLDIISRIRMCRTCRQNCRIVKFDFQCAKLYHDYVKSTAYSKPDLICFFNPGFHHINSLNGLDTWSETIRVASISDCPVVVTSYTEYESPRDLDRFQHETANLANQLDLIHGPALNAYASQRPERNFISDEIVPLIFKNYFCFVLK